MGGRIGTGPWTMDSILFNIGGRLFMLQQDLPMADQLMTREQVEWGGEGDNA